jgi:hypothetical protein
MARTVAAFLFAVVAYVVVAMAAVWTIAEIYALPPGTQVTDPAMVRAVLSCAPITAKLLVICGWALSAIAACLTSALVAGRAQMAWAGGLVAFVGTAWTLIETTQPVWVIVAGVVIPVAVASATAAVVDRRNSRRPEPN